MWTRHYDQTVFVPASPPQVFAFADDHSRLSAHLNESSWMMGGGRMSVEADEGYGQAVGSHIRLGGRVLGLRLSLDEVVTRRAPPSHKVWETVGTPRLVVIDMSNPPSAVFRSTNATAAALITARLHICCAALHSLAAAHTARRRRRAQTRHR